MRPVSTSQTATGVQAPRLKQMSMGMSAGAFNTREFKHGKSLRFVRHLKAGFLLLTLVLPAAPVMISLGTGSRLLLFAATGLQFVGLLGERWYFFAEARHPQNLYYQVIG